MAEKKATEILDEVKAVLVEREGNYDHPRPNFERIAAYWNTLLEDKLRVKLTAGDVANMMILMKVAREQFKHGEDNLKDIIGYAVCAQRIAEGEAVPENAPFNLDNLFPPILVRLADADKL